MSDSRYSYDENAEVWPYFAITLLGVVLVPSTISTVQSVLAPDEETIAIKERKESHKTENQEHIDRFLAKRRRSRLFSQSTLLVVLGWAAIAGLVYYTVSQVREDDAAQVFDPYDILGVSYSATERQIKSVYRKLTLKFHPDKIRDVGNSTREELEARYVDITKAYRALTDEVTRENFLKYGHPDGPQQTRYGIALPKFLVEGKGSPLVIAAYVLAVGIMLPIIVGSWWSNSKTYNKMGIHQTTAASFYEDIAKVQPHFMTYDKLLDVLCGAEEYRELLPHLSKKQVRELLDAHLGRRVVPNEADKLVVVERATTLLRGLLDIAEAFKDGGLCEKIVCLQRCVVQAVPVERQAWGEMLQLPGVTADDIEKAGGIDKFTPPQAARDYARLSVPRLVHLKSYFKVPGEKVVPPQSQTHLVIKFMVVPWGAEVPEVDPKLIEEEDEDEETNIKVLQEPLSTNDKAPVIPYAQAPYYPGFYRPAWYGFIIGERENKVVDGPAEMTRVSYDNLRLSDKELQDGTQLTIATFKMQITSASPPFPGEFAFKLALYSSGYFGCDIVQPISMIVQKPPPEPELEEPEPEDDEDAEGAEKEVDSDDEEEDLSDIDTDTEDEDEPESAEPEEPAKTK